MLRTDFLRLFGLGAAGAALGLKLPKPEPAGAAIEAHEIFVSDFGTITGIREQLSNAIYNISPVETPFITGDSTLYAWQTETLSDTLDRG